MAAAPAAEGSQKAKGHGCVIPEATGVEFVMGVVALDSTSIALPAAVV